MMMMTTIISFYRVVPLLFLLSVFLLFSPRFSAARGSPIEEVAVGGGSIRIAEKIVPSFRMTEDSLPFVLVTGSNGLVGSSIVHELLKRGHRVRGTVWVLRIPPRLPLFNPLRMPTLIWN